MPETARLLSPNELYLCDSGAQYLDGTTDVTRTISFGEPSHKEQVSKMVVIINIVTVYYYYYSGMFYLGTEGPHSPLFCYIS